MFRAVAMDYRGIPFVNGSAALSLAAASEPITVTVGAGETASCEWAVGREAYVRFATTALDTALGSVGGAESATPLPPAMLAAEKAFMLDLSVTATGSNGQVFEGTSRKLLCTPAVSTRGRIVCEGGRGTVAAPGADSAIDHLKACPTDGVVNDGECHWSRNNRANCWDGGDCCSVSCSLRNGGLLHQNEQGEVAFQHKCAELNDTYSCLDPHFAGGNHTNPAVFSDHAGEANALVYAPGPSDGGVECGEEGGGEGSGDGPGLFGTFAAATAAACGGGSGGATANCTDGCFAAVKAAVCDTDELAGMVHSCDLPSALASRGCSMPRCLPRTAQRCTCQSSWRYDGQEFAGRACVTAGGSDRPWCAVVAGSCATASGLPVEAVPAANGTGYNSLAVDGWWWDYCGARPRAPSGSGSGDSNGVGVVGDMEWRADELDEGGGVVAKPAGLPTLPPAVQARDTAQVCCPAPFVAVLATANSSSSSSGGGTSSAVSCVAPTAASTAAEAPAMALDGTCPPPFRAAGRAGGPAGSLRCAAPAPTAAACTTDLNENDGSSKSGGIRRAGACAPVVLMVATAVWSLA
jgi:hypothetical protein